MQILLTQASLSRLDCLLKEKKASLSRLELLAKEKTNWTEKDTKVSFASLNLD